MVRLLQAWLGLRERGQALVEYALILVLIAIVVIAILTILGTQVSTVFSSIVSGLQGS
ncbi:Flp family type IVb pilin [Thermoflexus hugenholtzii]|uniref:Pilus assembly protein Flp/PilA n=1 Tax=Thermoflexus hugenholtzii JAD2 TaxID=877466 RepID=A0A212QX58_9CHLR|nr:Flp family type IVb pilin [Thermoflexus hugenholtzii]SNB64302.1 pilus assembly protein Flp/PilA [Thermoflexus hugenholtzii JAD2]